MDEIKSGAMFKVREAGLEPARPKTQVPKTCVSANSTTPARVRRESRRSPERWFPGDLHPVRVSV